MSKKVSIVVLNYQNWQDTIECLESLLSITYPSHQVIVVDNASQNDSVNEITGWLASRNLAPLRLTQRDSETQVSDNNPFVLIQSDRNRGYAAGNNLGIRWAVRTGSPYVLILNNDTIVKNDFLESLVEFLENHADVAMVGPKVFRLDGTIDRSCARRKPIFADYIFRMGLIGRLFPNNYMHRRHYYHGDCDFSLPKRVDVISGSCMLIRSSILQKIGFLDENTFLFLEEFILSEQLCKTGMCTYIVPSSNIIHKHGKSISRRNNAQISTILKASLFYYLNNYRQFSRMQKMLIKLNLDLFQNVRSIKKYSNKC